MGKAIVLSGVDFPVKRKVHFTNVDGSIPVTSIVVTTDKTTMQVGETANLVATVLPADATNSNVLWTTSSNAIATVTPNGKLCSVTAIAPGTVVITCTSAGSTNIKFTTQIEVTNILLTGVTISGPTEIINSGKYTLSYLPTNTTQKGVVWSSSNTSIATIDNAGNLTVKTNGAVTITATSSANSAILDTFDVTCSLATIAVASVGLTAVGSPTTLDVNDSLSIVAAVLPETASDKTITWAVSNAHASIISSNDSGCVVKGITAGSVTITATSVADDTKVGTYNLTIQFVFVTNIALSANINPLRVGNSLALSAVMTPSNATDKAITWAVNNANATISPNGDACTVNAVTEGSVTVTATAVDGSGIVGTWTTTILPAITTDTTIIAHLESEDYVASSESWPSRVNNINAYVYGSPTKTSEGLTFPSSSRYCRFRLDVAPLYNGGDFTIFVDGNINYSGVTMYIVGLTAESGHQHNGFWLATRGETVGLVAYYIGVSSSDFKFDNKIAPHRGVITFKASTYTYTYYGIMADGTIWTKEKVMTATSPEYMATFLASPTHWLTNGPVTAVDGNTGSINDVNNNHTIKTVKMFNVVKTLEEITAMLTA